MIIKTLLTTTHSTMQLYKFVSTLLLTSSTLASPLLTPRACSHIYSPSLWSISQHVPETANGPFTTPFSVSQDIGKRDLIAAFNIPDRKSVV